MSEFQHILDQIIVITKHYNELEKQSGENFNIFKTIGFANDEVRIHSAFLAELLNPNGSHGQGGVFLHLFLQQCSIDFLDIDSARVIIEKSIGKKDDIEDSGGRIDIIIEDGKSNMIAIENKIYASDQAMQLLRYYNHIKGGKKFKLLYLTLDGKEASAASITSEKNEIKLKLGENYFAISYRNDIVQWLEACRKEVAVLPILREGITHYINLLKHLTNQSIYKKMDDQIIEILSQNPDNLKAAVKMESLVFRAKHKIQWSFWKTLKEKMEHEGFELLNNEEMTASSTKTYNYYAGRSKSVIGLFYPVMDVEDGKIYWGAEIEDNLFSGFTIITSEGNMQVSDQKMYAKYRDMVQSLNSDYKTDSSWWLGWKYTEPQLNFKSFNSDFIFALADEQQLRTFANKIVCEVKKEIEELKKRDNL